MTGFGLYVHWPWCARICPYCDFNVHRSRSTDDTDAMTAAIVRSVALWPDHGAPARPLDSIHFGGGTPSLAPPESIAAIIDAARQTFGLSADAEIGLEANPEDADPARFAALCDAGVERVSLGVQALDNAALTALGRMHTARQARDAIALALETFPRVSADLISARPGQTPGEWEAELGEALGLGLTHLSIYQLTIEPDTAFARAEARGALSPADEDAAADIYAATQAATAAAGLPAYEVSNHAAGPQAQSRHNLIYWRSGDWIAAGPGARGRLWAQDGARLAFAAPDRPDAYRAGVAAGRPAALEETLTPHEAAAEMAMMGLRLTEGLDVEALARRTGFAPDMAAAERLAAEGLLRITPGRIAATPAGRLVLDRLAAEIAP